MKTFVTTIIAVIFSMATSSSHAQEYYVVNAKNDINVQSLADSDSRVIATLKNGDTIPVYGFDGYWAQTKIDNIDGYVRSHNIKSLQKLQEEQLKNEQKSQKTEFWLSVLKTCFWLSIIFILIGAFCIKIFTPQKKELRCLIFRSIMLFNRFFWRINISHSFPQTPMVLLSKLRWCFVYDY